MKYAQQAVLLATIVTLGACSQETTSPRAAASDDRVFVHGGGATQQLSPTEKSTFQMTINPYKNTVWDLGAGNSLTFPKGSLCDPTSSSYGPGEWDKPCTATKSSVTLDVTVWVDSSGHPRVDFEPSVRFVPSVDPRDWVILTFADLQASVDPWYNINYCPTATSSCYNEAITDPSLATLRDPKNGKLTRRIKHFSGYNVAAGDEDDSGMELSSSASLAPRFGSMSISTDDLRIDDIGSVRAAYPGANAEDAETILLRIRCGQKLSGYILASGREEE